MIERTRFAGVFARLQPYRLWIQSAFLFVWLDAFIPRYHGVCAPVFHCYACPLATFACPIGVLANFSALHLIPFMTIGLLLVFGALVGSLFCGWACPFGLFQELLHKIPSVKLPVPRILTWLKYGFLALFVVILPLVVVDEFGLGAPWFCKYVCPAGTLEAGIPMLILQPDLKNTIGWIYWNKITILFLYVVWSIVSSRPFCRTTCPLGAFYALFNRHRLIRLQFNADNCTQCGACHRVCPMGINFNETPHSGECISCLKCMTQACNYGAISVEVAGYPLRDDTLPLKQKI